jgi:hypothetical protein
LRRFEESQANGENPVWHLRHTLPPAYGCGFYH